ETVFHDGPYVPSGKRNRTRVFVKVQDGCDSFCSYCVVPLLRGAPRSRPIAEILRELEDVSDAPEAVICGINLAAYSSRGKDFIDLVEEISKTFSFRIRLSSLEPDRLDEEKLNRLFAIKSLAPHFHLPLQSGSGRILRLMKRKYDLSFYMGLVKKIRKWDPLAGVTTDIIAGFPDESDEDFLETVRAVRQAEFSRAHLFTYSSRPGTAASLMAQLPEPVKKERKKELERWTSLAERDFLNKNIGAVLSVAAERNTDGIWEGMSGNYVRVFFPGSARRPRLEKVVITEVIPPRGLRAEFLKERQK
ncbi:MAG TPA: radical SAM protein, partial [bacterium]|nr:radical SAM protein [bacterium]